MQADGRGGGGSHCRKCGCLRLRSGRGQQGIGWWPDLSGATLKRQPAPWLQSLPGCMGQQLCGTGGACCRGSNCIWQAWMWARPAGGPASSQPRIRVPARPVRASGEKRGEANCSRRMSDCLTASSSRRGTVPRGPGCGCESSRSDRGRPRTRLRWPQGGARTQMSLRLETSKPCSSRR